MDRNGVVGFLVGFGVLGLPWVAAMNGVLPLGFIWGGGGAADVLRSSLLLVVGGVLLYGVLAVVRPELKQRLRTPFHGFLAGLATTVVLAGLVFLVFVLSFGR